ncbi:isoflavone reductase family protein [Paramyrothecium foliicola]|nr:isoflavone reductase family protein [Paramyrothecium foliicola]
MIKQSVFLVGATGETGSSILEALIEDGSFDLTCFIRAESVGKAAVQGLISRGQEIVTGDLSGPKSELVTLLQGIDTVISIVTPSESSKQIPLIDAAAEAGVKRFLPCNWAAPVARGGIMLLRDMKEDVHDHIFRHRLGYTIIDVGFWYQISFPRFSKAKYDYPVSLPVDEVYAGGTAPNMLIDKRDVGRITARIIKDERTLNKRVYVYGEVISQNEIHAAIERKTGEKPQAIPIEVNEIYRRYQEASSAYESEPGNIIRWFQRSLAEYSVAKYIRKDNTPENAEYLGYISGRSLYPDFEFISFDQFVDDLMAGAIERPYPHLQL